MVLWTVSFSLGYATLNRYSPEEVPGLSDSRHYYRMARGEHEVVPPPFRLRPLVPALVRGTQVIVARLPLGSWDPTRLSFLIVCGAFVAAASMIIAALALIANRESSEALLASFVYATAFPVVNMQLCGLVDAAEGLAIAALAFGLGTHRMSWAMGIVTASALVKESAPLLATSFAGAWIILGPRWPALSRAKALAGIALAATAAGCVLVALAWTEGLPAGAHLPKAPVPGSLGTNLLDCLTAHSLLYTFAALAPTAWLMRHTLPAALVPASWVTAAVALVAGVSAGVAENVTRLVFGACGPMLALGAARGWSALVSQSRPRTQPTPPAT